jgi:hypothetical protein
LNVLSADFVGNVKIDSNCTISHLAVDNEVDTYDLIVNNTGSIATLRVDEMRHGGSATLGNLNVLSADFVGNVKIDSNCTISHLAVDNEVDTYDLKVNNDTTMNNVAVDGLLDTWDLKVNNNATMDNLRISDLNGTNATIQNLNVVQMATIGSYLRVNNNAYIAQNLNVQQEISTGSLHAYTQVFSDKLKVQTYTTLGSLFVETNSTIPSIHSTHITSSNIKCLNSPTDNYDVVNKQYLSTSSTRGNGINCSWNSDRFVISANISSALGSSITVTPGTSISIGIDSAMQTAMNEMKQWLTPAFGIPARIELWAGTRYILQSAELAAASASFDYLVTNIPLRQRDTVLLGVTDEVIGLVFWQSTVNANLDTVRNIVDNTDTVLGSRRGDADVWSTGSNRLVINNTKTIEITNLNTSNGTITNIRSSDITSSNIRSNNIILNDFMKITNRTSNGNCKIVFENDDTINSRDKVMISSHNTSGYFGISDLHFCLNNETNNNNVSLSDSRLVIKSNGFIGINQSNPQEYLDVFGSVKASTLKSTDLTTGTLHTNIGNITGLNAGGVITNTLTLNGTDISTKLNSIDTSISNLNFSTITNLNSTNATISNLIVGTTNVSTKLASIDTSISNLDFSTITNLNSTNATISNLIVGTTNVSTKLNSIDTSISNLDFSTITNLNSTNATISNLIVGTTNVSTKLASIDTSISNLSFTPNFTNITNTNLVSTNSTITNLTVTNSTISNFSPTLISDGLLALEWDGSSEIYFYQPNFPSDYGIRFSSNLSGPIFGKRDSQNTLFIDGANFEVADLQTTSITTSNLITTNVSASNATMTNLITTNVSASNATMTNLRMTNATMTNLYCPGTILNVQSYTYNGNATTNDTNWKVIDSNFKVTITPKFSSSNIMVTAMLHIGGEQDTDGRWTLFRLERAISGGSTSYIGNGSTSGTTTGTACIASHTPAGDYDYMVWNMSVNYMDSPNTTSAITYSFHWNSNPGGSGSRKAWINRSDNHNDGFRGNTISTITVMEICG